MRVSGVLLAVVVAVPLEGCGSTELPPVPLGIQAQPLPIRPNPCGARNPVRLLDVRAERTRGAPRDDVFRFTLPAATDACVRITNPLVDGHRVDAAWVRLDGASLLGPDAFTQAFEGIALSRELLGGPHAFEVRVASKPGTRLVIQVEVAGPVIDSFTPQYAPTGTQLVVTGEGFVGPLTVTAGAVALANSRVASATTVAAITVANMPVGPLTVTTPYGSATSVGDFVPSQPRGLVPFYPMADFELGNLACGTAGHLAVRQDGARVGFAITAEGTHEPATIELDIDTDNEPETVELTLSGAMVDSVAVVSETFERLDLYGHLGLGRLGLRVRSVGNCGPQSSPWIELRSALAPGFLIVRTSQPLAVASRNGLSVVETEGDLALMQLRPPQQMEEKLVALARDPDAQGAIPDTVLYSAAPPRRLGCGIISGPVLEMGPEPRFPQWTLERMGIVEEPSPLAGAGIVVAVLDSGLDAHPEMLGASIPGLDVTIFGDGTTTDSRTSRHGTGVASVIAARQGNGGMVGIAPGAAVMPIRVMGRFGLTDGFGIHRALTAVIDARGRGVNIQVVNISMAEFLDTGLLVGGLIAALLERYALGGTALVGGLVVHGILRERVTTLVDAGVAVVAAAGNYGDTVLAAFGMQFPASAPGVFAIAASDQNNRVVADSMRAIVGQRVALSAPSTTLLADGSLGAGTMALGTGSLRDGSLVGPIVDCVGSATSFAAPHMAGAIAVLLAPPPPLLPAAPTGLLAALRLVEAATPMVDPPEAAGAGLLTLSPSLFLPQANWSLDFQSLWRRIDDFGFLPGFSDYALRNGGGVIERIDGPGGNIAQAVMLSAPANWLNAHPPTRQLVLGFPDRVEVWDSTVHSRAALRATPSFRAAVSTTWTAPTATVPGGSLILLGLPDGRVELVRGGSLAPLTRVSPEEPGEVFLDALWVSDPSLGSGAAAIPDGTSELFAARTATRIEFFRVGSALRGACTTTAMSPDCPVRVGSVSLVRSDAPGVAIAPHDWAVVAEPSGPRAYVVNGTTEIFHGQLGGALSAVTPSRGIYNQVESSNASLKVYAADLNTPAFVTLRNGATEGAVDASRAGVSTFLMGPGLRVAPAGTYAYAPGDIQRTNGDSWAVTFTGLVP